MNYCLVNPPPGEEVDYATIVDWLNQEYPDGWVIVHGRGAHRGLCAAMLGLGAGDTVSCLFTQEEVVGDGDDRCRYCKHKRSDHTLPVRIGCNHGICTCFHFEEPENELRY